MKKWNAAEIVELNINETAQNFFGTEYDGGYIGDGHVGILKFPDPTPTPTPENSGNQEDQGNQDSDSDKLS